MTQFIDSSKKYPSSIPMVVATVSLVLIAYFLGGSGLLFDYEYAKDFATSQAPDTSQYIQVLGSNRVLFWMLLPFTLSFVIFLVAIKWIHKRPVLSVFTGRDQLDWMRICTSFFIVFFFLTIISALQICFSDDIIWSFEWNTFFPLLLIACLIIPIQTTIEELLFRGYLLQGIKRRLGSNIQAVVLSGFFFGLIHLGNPEIEAIGVHVLSHYVLLGLFLGLLTLFDNGLELSMGFHAANNIFAALMISSDWQVFQTEALFVDYAAPEFTFSMFGITLLFLIVLIFLFKRMYGWGSLKDYLR